MSSGSRVATPSQARSRASLERVMEAGMAVLVQEGWDGFTIAAACQRAGVTTGLVYRRFRNRDALLAALQDRWLSWLEAEQERTLIADPGWAARSLPDIVRAAIDGLVAVPRAQEGPIRALSLHGTFDADGQARLVTAVRRWGAWFCAALLMQRDAIAHPDPERAADFCFRFVIDAIIRRATLGDEFDTGHRFGGWDAFADELWSAACAYLLRPQPVSAARIAARTD